MLFRSHPTLEARGGGREEQPHLQGAVAARAQEGLEELFHIPGQKGRTTGISAFPLGWPWEAQSSPRVARAVGPPDLERGIAPLGPPAPAQPPLLGGGVAPLGCCP